MSYPSYPYGYWYPNNFAEPVLWTPLPFVYVLIVSGPALLFMVYLSYLTGRLRELLSLRLVVGLAMFLVILIGPLADSRAPDNTWKAVVGPRLLPSDANPGFSLMAIQGIFFWVLGAAVSILFTLLYFSYPMYLKYRQTKNPIYKIFSLGVSNEGRYRALEKVLKFLAFVGILIMLSWLAYPATLFMQTYNFIWQNTMSLPIMFVIEKFVADTAVVILIALLVRYLLPKLEVELKPILAIVAIASAATIVVLLIQMGIWLVRFVGSPYYPAFTHLYGFLGVVLALYFIALVTSIASFRVISLSVIAALAGLLAYFLNKWTFMIKAQEVAMTGLGVMEVALPLKVYLEIISVFALGIFLTMLFISLFPIDFKPRRGERV
ncbi:MAG: NrfD/PsrC family molybdoenzyme membrane anchor subunit [Pyrobaculum sp.]